MKVNFEMSNVSEGTGLARKTSETAKNFIINCATEFIGKPDYQVRVLHIKNGVILRFMWDRVFFSIDLYDDKYSHNLGDGDKMEHVEEICKYLDENIGRFYIDYIEYCMSERLPIYLPGCDGILYDKRKKMYYSASWENGKEVKTWIDPYGWLVGKSNSTKRIWTV